MPQRKHDHNNLGGSNRGLTLREAAPMVGKSYDSLRRRYREWGIPTFKVGRSVRIRERALEAWIKTQSQDGDAA